MLTPMHKPDVDDFFVEIEASAALIADIISTHDPDLPVPTCPDWTLRHLATHIGRVHRWAAEIVTTRATDRISFDSVPDGRYPAAVADRAAWIRAGAARVIEAIKAAEDEPVWTFGRLAPASFWARRQAHETAMHRVDAQLSVGRMVELDPDLATDGIDEWLEMVTRYRGRDGVTQALPPGTALHLLANGQDGDEASAEWVIRRAGEGLSLQRGPGVADVSVSGPADRLLLALVRRVAADEASLAITGDAALFSGWLAGTPF